MDQKQHYIRFFSELQRRLLYLAAVFGVFSIIGFVYSEKIIVILIKAVNLSGVNVVFTSPFQFVELAFSTAFLLGAAASIPFFLYQVLQFSKPALKPKEYRFIITRLPISMVLFGTGFASGLMIMRYVINLFYEKSVSLEIGNLLDVTKLLSQITITSTLMGIAFQMPIVINFLLELKIVPLSFFDNKRKFAYLLSLLFAALLPPTDILSLVLLALPVAILYESSLLYYRLSYTK